MRRIVRRPRSARPDPDVGESETSTLSRVQFSVEPNGNERATTNNPSGTQRSNISDAAVPTRPEKEDGGGREERLGASPLGRLKKVRRRLPEVLSGPFGWPEVGAHGAEVDEKSRLTRGLLRRHRPLGSRAGLGQPGDAVNGATVGVNKNARPATHRRGGRRHRRIARGTKRSMSMPAVRFMGR